MSNQPEVYALRFEHYACSIGIGHAKPRLSWRYRSNNSTAADWTQSSYDIEITGDSPSNKGSAEVFRVSGEGSVLVPWPGQPLKSRERVRVRVRAYSSASEQTVTEWSGPEIVEAALLDVSEWKAKPIAIAQNQFPKDALQPTRFRKTFSLAPGSTSTSKVRIYATAWGVYELYLNGTRVGDQVLAPGWTSYKHRLLYQVYDVPLDLLRKNGKENVLAVEVGEGWYAGRLGFNGGKRFLYGERLATLIQMEVEFEGQSEPTVVCSDSSWKCTSSAILTSEFYDGEVYDMNLEHKGWNESPGIDEKEWSSTEELDLSLDVLEVQEAPPVKITETITPKEIFRCRSGKVIVDFGQNLVGKVYIRKLKLKAGQKVVITHAEVLENGEAGTRPLRDAKCKDTIIFSDEELVQWAPRFTFHGFRYVSIEGWETNTGAGLPAKEDLSAFVIHTDMHRTGYFSCSEPLINQLHKNVVWGMRGNFFSIPTDCPQRDERLGWTGDINVFTPTANFIYDTSSMLNSWLNDLQLEQLRDEPHCTPGIVVPNILRDTWHLRGQAIWQDVSVLTPWNLYRSFADIELLRRQFDSMKGWVEEGISRGADGLWDPEFWQLGDWLDPAAPADEPSQGRTDGTLVADAYLVRVITTLAAVSKLLGSTSDAEKYAAQAQTVKKTFQDKYITPLGLLVSETQTAISLALCFDLYRTPEERVVAGQRLSRLVRATRFRISTGFAGTPIITHALASTNQPQLAYRMLHEDQCPSWLYPVKMGATTCWERWDSMLPDGSINPGEMTSFNHFALGSVADFLHTTVGGIAPLEPGWKVVKVRPVPGGKVTHAEVKFEGPYGLVSCSWTLEGDSFKAQVEIPPNSKGLIILPGQKDSDGKMVGSGKHSFDCKYQLGAWPKAMFDPFCAPGIVQADYPNAKGTSAE